MKSEDIFLGAVERSTPFEQAAFLDAACGNDRGLRIEVEGLIASHEQTGSFLEGPLFDSAATFAHVPQVEMPGTVIGPYKLLEPIGEGGMGTVYMAEQVEPVRRRVALKVIKPGMDSKQVDARFEAERQALAMMDHPNIAMVHDAGMTASGRPYFVMELVRGLPITDYCDREQLPITERLELFVLVCRAVQHAHQKGIIHRDLKPSNVLVTVIDGVALPKVIDFGVAKATGQALTEKTLVTGFHQFVGTPLYMSPEQADLSGADADTRSDIYSLGVLLYELLTGTTPLDSEMLKQAAFDEMRRIIREEEPPKPSTRLSALGATQTAVSASRRADARHLDRAVRGELDWIVMKALEKDRRRRYETANDFAADVMRHLTDRPVEACPPSVRYRFSKYARRNRTALTTAAVVGLALVLGMGASLWQAARATTAERKSTAALGQAEENLLLARRAVDELYDQVSARWASPHTLHFAPLPRTFLEKSLPFYQGFAAPRQVESSVGRAHQRIGEILIQLGRRGKSEEALHRAEAIFKALVAVDPDNPGYLESLGSCYTVMSTYYMFDPITQDNILAWQADLARRFPEVSRYRLQLASSHLGQGIRYWNGGRFPQAIDHLEQARAILEQSSATEATDPNVQNILGHILRDLANAQRDLNSNATAERHYRRALDLHETLVVRYPTRPQYQLNLGWDCWELCRFLLRVGKYDEAEPFSTKALAIFEGLSSDYPDVDPYRMYRALALADRAGSLLRTGQPSKAETLISRLEALDDRPLASACLSQIAWFEAQEIGSGRPDPARAVELAHKAIALAPNSSEAWHALGQAHYRAGDWKAAIAALEREGTSPTRTMYRLEDSPAYGGFFQAMAYQKRGDPQQARARYDRSAACMTEHRRQDPILVRYRSEAASLLAVELPPEDRESSTPYGSPDRLK